VVALQEVISIIAPLSVATLVADNLLDVCPEPYTMTFIQTNGIDDAILLSRYPMLDASVTLLLGGFRHVLHGRLDHPAGPIDLFTTHLASGSDGATNPCGASCPTECVVAGATTIRECQAEQTALLVETLHDVPEPAFLMGDMNAEPGEFEIDRFTSRGWIDTYLAAGNPECDPGTGVGCTGGRSESQMEETALNVDERIDYVFLVPTTATASPRGSSPTPPIPSRPRADRCRTRCAGRRTTSASKRTSTASDGSGRSGDHPAQHVRQHAAVAVVVDVVRRIDARHHLELPYAVAGTRGSHPQARTRREGRDALDVEGLRPVETERGGALARKKLERKHAHADEVRSMNALVGLGDDGFHAE